MASWRSGSAAAEDNGDTGTRPKQSLPRSWRPSCVLCTALLVWISLGRQRWDGTPRSSPPFFIVGAFLSGFAMVIILVVPLRRLLQLEQLITGRHIDVLCRLMATSSLCLLYCYVMDAFSTWYGADGADKTMFAAPQAEGKWVRCRLASACCSLAGLIRR